MPTIKFRPHAVVTYYNGSLEAVAVDFTPAHSLISLFLITSKVNLWKLFTAFSMRVYASRCI